MSWDRPPMVLDVGQVDDVTRSLPSGEGRLHAQTFPDGSVRVHRDRYDPARGPVEALAHVLVETPAGLLLAGVVLVAVLAAQGGEE